MAILSGNRASRGPEPGRQIDSSVDIMGLAETLVRRWWVVLASIIVFVALAFFALHTISPRYNAVARILIDPREQRAVQNEVVQQGLGSDMALVESQIEVIKSGAVLGRVVKEAGLATDPEFVPPTAAGRDPFEVALEGLAKATEVTRRDNTYVIDIGVTTKNATKSARLANAIAAAFVQDQTSSATAAVRDVSTAINSRLAELQTQLHDSEEKVEAFKREHNISSSEGQLLGDRELTSLSASQAAALARVNDAKARLQVMQDALRTRGDVGASAADTDSSLGTLRIRLADAKQRLADTGQVLGPRHPRYIAAREEVAQAEAAVRTESERLVSAARDDYQAAVAAQNKVNDDLKQATDTSFSTNKDLIKLRELEREAQSIKVVYESFLVRAKETAQQEGLNPRTARVIAAAAVPDNPSFPPRMPLLAAGAVLGLFVGILAAILLDLVAGLLGRSQRASPAAAVTSTGPAMGGMVLVTTLGDAAIARRAARDMAHSAIARDRSVILLDFANDASATLPGLAEIALDETSPLDAVRIRHDSDLHMLNAGRPAAVAKVSQPVLSAMLRDICAEYDDVVVNVGELDGEHNLPAQVVANMARQIVLVARGGQADNREAEAAEVLSNNGAVAVSVVPAEAEKSLGQVA